MPTPFLARLIRHAAAFALVAAPLMAADPALAPAENPGQADWTKVAPGSYPVTVTAADGTVVTLDHLYHLRAADPQGKQLWTVDQPSSRSLMPNAMRIDGDQVVVRCHLFQAKAERQYRYQLATGVAIRNDDETNGPGKDAQAATSSQIKQVQPPLAPQPAEAGPKG